MNTRALIKWPRERWRLSNLVFKFCFASCVQRRRRSCATCPYRTITFKWPRRGNISTLCVDRDRFHLHTIHVHTHTRARSLRCQRTRVSSSGSHEREFSANKMGDARVFISVSGAVLHQEREIRGRTNCRRNFEEKNTHANSWPVSVRSCVPKGLARVRAR